MKIKITNDTPDQPDARPTTIYVRHDGDDATAEHSGDLQTIDIDMPGDACVLRIWRDFARPASPMIGRSPEIQQRIARGEIRD